MNIKTLTFGCAALAASMVQAATVDFPKAGGDLASAADWGGALPAATDTAQVSKNGTYTLSTDVSFANLVSTASDALFDFTGHTVYPQTTQWAVLMTEKNTKLTVKGGTIQVDNGQTALLQGAANAQLVLDGVTLKGTHSGDYDFTVSGYSAGGVVVVSNKSTITCRSLYASVNGATGTRFEIVDGSKVYADYRVRTCKGGTNGDAGGNIIRISGTGSLLCYTGSRDFEIGFNHTDETVIVDDHGELDATGKTLSLGGGAIACRAKLMLCNGATAKVGTLNGHSYDCALLVSNATFTATAFALGDAAGNTGNTARFYNAKVSIPWTNPFGGKYASANTISLEGGTIVSPGNVNAMFYRETNCVLRISGAGTRFGMDGAEGNFYMGNKDDFAGQSSVSNTVYLGDGAVMDCCRFVLTQTGNQLVIDNATLNLNGDDSVGFRCGYDGAPAITDKRGCKLVLKGAQPKLMSNSTVGNTFLMQNESILRFEIPAEGYPEGHVVITAQYVKPSSDTTLEIDCAEWVEKTGGKLHLVHTRYMGAAEYNWWGAYDKLPEKARIVIENGEGGAADIYLKSPKRTGLSVIIR